MAEAKEYGRITNWGPIILTGFVSLVVGVGGGVLVKYLTEKSGRLTYDVTAIQAFPGQTQRVGIIAVRVSNTGKKEVEDVLCRVTLTDAEITESTLSPAIVPVHQSQTSAEFAVGFLNPTESISLQLLVQPKSESLEAPQVDLRGKGIVGQVNSAAAADKRDDWLIVVAATSAMLSSAMIFMIRLTRRRPLSGDADSGHFDDQRDVLAFVLGASDFEEEATAIRNSDRKRSYWAICDELTEKWLAANDLTIMGRGIVTLNRCIDYAAIADSSKRLVHLNIARLALRRGEEEVAKHHMKCARKGSDGVVEKRIAFDEALQELAEH